MSLVLGTLLAPVPPLAARTMQGCLAQGRWRMDLIEKGESGMQVGREHAMADGAAQWFARSRGADAPALQGRR
jgi:hypothetical protein